MNLQLMDFDRSSTTEETGSSTTTMGKLEKANLFLSWWKWAWTVEDAVQSAVNLIESCRDDAVNRRESSKCAYMPKLKIVFYYSLFGTSLVPLECETKADFWKSRRDISAKPIDSILLSTLRERLVLKNAFCHDRKTFVSKGHISIQLRNFDTASETSAARLKKISHAIKRVKHRF